MRKEPGLQSLLSAFSSHHPHTHDVMKPSKTLGMRGREGDGKKRERGENDPFTTSPDNLGYRQRGEEGWKDVGTC